MSDAYIVVLDVAADSVRALLFDREARRVEGYSAQLPRKADAAADCLDEMHRLASAAEFPIGAVVGRAESEVTAEDRQAWPAFEGAAWFPALPEGAGAMLGSGCVGRERVALLVGESSMAGTVVERPLTVDGLHCERIDDKRWLLSRGAPQAGLAYASFKHAIKGSVEEFLERAAADDPRRAALDSAVQQFREVYEILSRALETPPQHVIGCGEVLWKAPSLAQRIADAVGVPLTISTEPEPGCRGAALWALERIGAIERLDDLPASMGPRFIPIFVETTK